MVEFFVTVLDHMLCIDLDYLTSHPFSFVHTKFCWIQCNFWWSWWCAVIRLICFLKVIERLANNLEVAGRQRTQMNGRGARLRSALELLNLVNPTDMNCILHLARFYMLYNMDLSELMSTIVKLQDVRKENTIHYYLKPY